MWVEILALGWLPNSCIYSALLRRLGPQLVGLRRHLTGYNGDYVDEIEAFCADLFAGLGCGHGIGADGCAGVG